MSSAPKTKLSLTRRTALVSAGAAGLAACATGSTSAYKIFAPRFDELETRLGGRVGFVALNTLNGDMIAYRADERFAMCSMFKWLLACAALETLPSELPVVFTEADLIEPDTGVRPHLAEGAMSVAALAEAGILYSDNAAANLLLRRLGGPQALTAFLRAHGDWITRCDRFEPDLNENAPADPRDTTTPAAMVRTLRALLTTDALRTEVRERVIAAMIATETGRSRLRGGLPAAWRTGDKTGTSLGDHNAVTDAVIAWPPGRPPILMAGFISDSQADLPVQNAAHAEMARMVSAAWS